MGCRSQIKNGFRLKYSIRDGSPKRDPIKWLGCMYSLWHHWFPWDRPRRTPSGEYRDFVQGMAWAFLNAKYRAISSWDIPIRRVLECVPVTVSTVNNKDKMLTPNLLHLSRWDGLRIHSMEKNQLIVNRQSSLHSTWKLRKQHTAMNHFFHTVLTSRGSSIRANTNIRNIYHSNICSGDSR